MKTSSMPADPSSVALVIVTHNRPDFLVGLLESVNRMTTKPGLVLVVDNASAAPTPDIVRNAAQSAEGFRLVYKRLETNSGGAGGFSAGVAEALALGAEWLWLMDDDLEILPDGLALLLPWTDRFKCLHGQRYDFDGSPFFCQQWISEWLGIQLPFWRDPFGKKRYFLTNYGCFEGMFIHRDVVEAIGLPDPRFFIVWDDAIYGWLASRMTEVAFVDSFVLRRTRQQRQISLGVRHLNDASDLTRFYMMRNRAMIERYLKLHRAYRPLTFRVGTLLVFCKELLRLLVVERSLAGAKSLVKGMRAAKALRREPNWQPMPPLRAADLARDTELA